MIDTLLLILIIIAIIFIIFISIFTVEYFLNPEEVGCVNNFIYKTIAILGLIIVFVVILLLPLDVANSHGDGGGLNMKYLWNIFFILIFIFALIIIPLMITIYEFDPESTTGEKIKNGFLFFIIDVIIISGLFFILFLCFNKANISFDTQIRPISEYKSSNIKNDNIINNTDFNKKEEKNISIKIPFIIFSFGLMSFGAYFFLTLFGGIGIFALPLDLIRTFCIRPIKISKNRLEEMKKEIVQTSIDLKELAKKVKNMEENGYNKKFFWSN
jgi:hypothetical protein